MKVIFIFVATILAFSSCNDPGVNNDEPYGGECAFAQRKLDITAEPSTALEDTTITLKVTVYPKFIGTGKMQIGLGAPSSWVLLEHPYYDTLKTTTNIWVYPKFETTDPFTQEWKFKLLRTFSSSYNLEIFAGYDSVFITDSSKMYAIDSPELNKIKWIDGCGISQMFTLKKP